MQQVAPPEVTISPSSMKSRSARTLAFGKRRSSSPRRFQWVVQ